MNVRFNVEVKDGVTLPMKHFFAALKHRKSLHRAMGLQVRELCREHLRMISGARRNKLGAPSSKFWGKAADKVATPVATDESAVIAINHPGVRRAFGDVRITAGTQTPGVKFLTIPLIVAAYNRRAYRLDRTFFVWVSAKKQAFLAERNVEGKLTLWYLLIRSVLQRQDRSLLPSDDALEGAALHGMKLFIRQKRAEVFGGAQ